LAERAGFANRSAYVTAGLTRLTILIAPLWLGCFVVVLPILAASGVDCGCAALLAAPGLVATLGASALVLQRAFAHEQRARARESRLKQLALMAGRLSRLRDPCDVAARAEPLARAMLGDVAIRVTRAGAEPPQFPPNAMRAVLVSRGGAQLGRLDVHFPAERRPTSEDHAAVAEIAGIIAAAMDGANMLAEAERARAEVELILSTMSDGVLVLDRQWAVRYANCAASGYLRRMRAELIGARLWDVFPDWWEGAFGRNLRQAMEADESVNFEAAYPTLGAFYEMRCYPLASGLTVYFRDIAAQRETEEKLRQSQKLEALGHLTGGIAHDVNNLLTVILGNFEMLAMGAEERGEEGAADLGLAEAGRRAGESASALMRRLLTFSRRQALCPRVVDVAALLRSLEPLLQGALGEPVTLRISCPAGLWPALVDPVELENAILNLAINARDAMPSGGQLTIEAGNVPVDRVYAALAGIEEVGDYIMLSVADTGLGMSRHVAAKAFDPFFTTKETGKGTGLGLSMVYGFAKQSGGHAVIDSEVGQGTSVRLYLPRTSEAPLASPEREADIERAAARGSETILLVEDNDQVRVHTEAMLRGLGYTVVAAADGPSALSLLRRWLAEDTPSPDLLLTDVVLPGGMSGRDLAEAAVALIPTLRVLFASGYPGTVLEEDGRMAEGVELVCKPFRRTHLAARIRGRLAGPPRFAVGWPALAGQPESLS